MLGSCKKGFEPDLAKQVGTRGRREGSLLARAVIALTLRNIPQHGFMPCL